MTAIDDPGWVDAVLEWRPTWLIARISLTSAYLLGGMVKLLDFPAAIAEQEHFGLHPGWLWAALSILVELGGSALVISGRFVWLGAGGLGVLTAVAMLVANDFWDLQDRERSMALNAFFEHVGLIAGFILAALITEHEKRLSRARSNNVLRVSGA
jgi:uncharacterized membrane protein YphA (DoxX/SURF4 family)